MSESSLTLLAAVEEVARLAGDAALGYFRERPAVEIKADGSPVTIADRAAERAARDWIAARFPADGIVGEEMGRQAGKSGRLWLIDPIDGTKSFVRGVPLWGTLIAVCRDDVVLAGAVYCPAVGELMVAAESEGCWLNGARAKVSTVAKLADAAVLSTDAGTPRRLVEAAAVARTWGDCYGYLMVAAGRAEVMIDATVNEWDSAAVQRCVVEAGGVFTDWEGTPTAFGKNAIATNALVADEARRLLR